MRRGFNSRTEPESDPKCYRADIPVMGEVVLEKLKSETLVPALMACHEKLQSIEVHTIYDRLRYRAAERKLLKAQNDYRAASFIANGGNNHGRIVTSNEVGLINTANRLIYEALLPLNSPEMSGEALALSSMITLYPVEAPPPSYEISLSA